MWYGKRELQRDIFANAQSREATGLVFPIENMSNIANAVRYFRDGHATRNGLLDYYGAAIGNIIAAEREENIDDFTKAVNDLLSLAEQE